MVKKIKFNPKSTKDNYADWKGFEGYTDEGKDFGHGKEEMSAEEFKEVPPKPVIRITHARAHDPKRRDMDYDEDVITTTGLGKTAIERKTRRYRGG